MSQKGLLSQRPFRTHEKMGIQVPRKLFGYLLAHTGRS